MSVSIFSLSQGLRFFEYRRGCLKENLTEALPIYHYILVQKMKVKITVVCFCWKEENILSGIIYWYLFAGMKVTVNA